MKVTQSKFLLVFLFFLVVVIPTLAQSTKNKDKETNNKESLQGLTKAILIDGQPTLKILSTRNGSSEIKLQRRDNEDALVFNVVKLRVKPGTLYVTKTKVVFESNEGNNSFSIEKNTIKQLELIEKGKFFQPTSLIKIVAADDTKLVTIQFSDDAENNKEYAIPGNNFLLKSISDFNSALAEFVQLTAGAQQNNETAPLIAVSKYGTNVDYDRFKDITTVSTIPVNVFDDKKISDWGLSYFRMFGQYQVIGSVGQLPKTVKLAFSWSGIRPFFANESEKTLNLIVDGKRTNYGELHYGGLVRVGTLGFKEQVWVEMSITDFESFINAKSIEMQLANLEFALQPAQIESLRRLLSDVKVQ